MITFYEKPGCKTNTRQKADLAAAGYEVDARDIRKEVWSPESLRPFFGDLPVRDWFNLTAPPVKSGEIDVNSISEADALEAMVRTPILIRRPLIASEAGKACGFKEDSLIRVGLERILPDQAREACSGDHRHPCEEPLRLSE